MSSFSSKVFLNCRSPIIQFKRFRGKINIQRPRQPHYERARVIAVTTPIYPEKPKNLNCFEKTNLPFKQNLHNPYNDIIAREVLNWFNHSSMVGIYHLNPISQDDLFKIRVAVHKESMTLKSYGRKIIQQAVENTKYEAILPLFVADHCIVFSPEQKVSKLLKITKKAPQMILVGGILENRLMSKNEFTEFASMPDLQTARSQLVGVLNSAAGQIVNHLEAHQKVLVNCLDVHAKSGRDNEVKNDDNNNKTENIV